MSIFVTICLTIGIYLTMYLYSYILISLSDGMFSLGLSHRAKIVLSAVIGAALMI